MARHANVSDVIALLIVAFALGLDNFAASVGIGVSGVQRALRIRVAVVFGLFETAMPVVGLLLGRGLAADLGGAARWSGAGLLAAAGAYELVSAVRSSGDEESGGMAWGGWRMLVSGAALSLDNLVVGFALGALKVPLIAAIAVFGVVSVAMSLAGLELGAKLGALADERGELIAGVALICVGAAMAAGWLLPAVPYCGSMGGRFPLSSRSNSPSFTPSTNASHSASVK
jgi:putative Mn2+ efflux pump MntP